MLIRLLLSTCIKHSFFISHNDWRWNARLPFLLCTLHCAFQFNWAISLNYVCSLAGKPIFSNIEPLLCLGLLSSCAPTAYGNFWYQIPIQSTHAKSLIKEGEKIHGKSRAMLNVFRWIFLKSELNDFEAVFKNRSLMWFAAISPYFPCLDLGQLEPHRRIRRQSSTFSNFVLSKRLAIHQIHSVYTSGPCLTTICSERV